MVGKTILILGGGVGGIVTANALRKKLGNEHEIVLVDKRAEYVYTPSLLWVMVGWRKPSQITKNIQQFLEAGIKFHQASIQEIDTKAEKIRTSTGDLSYDYLVIALGADLAPQKLAGFQDAAFTPYNLEGATALWSALQDFDGGRLAVLVSSMPYKCPAAPYETAMLLEDHLRKRGIREGTEVDIYTPEGLPMGVTGAEMGHAVVNMMAEKGIRFHPGFTVSGIDVDKKVLNFSNQDSVSFELLAGIPPHSAPAVLSSTTLVNAGGWIPVNRFTLQSHVENVFAIGDVAAITLENGKPLPKAGVFAEGQGLTVAETISDQIEGSSKFSEYDGLGFCWIESGSGSAGFASGKFYAEPDPIVPLPRSGRIWHLGKVLFEKYWMGDGITRKIAKFGLEVGSKAFGIDVNL